MEDWSPQEGDLFRRCLPQRVHRARHPPNWYQDPKPSCISYDDAPPLYRGQVRFGSLSLTRELTDVLTFSPVVLSLLLPTLQPHPTPLPMSTSPAWMLTRKGTAGIPAIRYTLRLFNRPIRTCCCLLAVVQPARLLRFNPCTSSFLESESCFGCVPFPLLPSYLYVAKLLQATPVLRLVSKLLASSSFGQSFAHYQS